MSKWSDDFEGQYNTLGDLKKTTEDYKKMIEKEV